MSHPITLAKTTGYRIADNLQLPLVCAAPTPALSAFPLYAAKISAGFPSPADDYLEASIDLNQHYIRHPAATFFVRVQGNSMTGAGIHHGDMLVVDRALHAKSGSIVIAVVNGELTVKRLIIEDQQVYLQPENPAYPRISLNGDMELHIWGVVAHVIHSFT